MKDKERLRNCHRLKETAEMLQIDTMQDPGIGKGHPMVGKQGKFESDLMIILDH